MGPPPTARPKVTTAERVTELWVWADTALEHVHGYIVELDRLDPASECAEARASALNARRMLAARYQPVASAANSPMGDLRDHA